MKVISNWEANSKTFLMNTVNFNKYPNYPTHTAKTRKHPSNLYHILLIPTNPQLERGNDDYVKGLVASADSLHRANVLSVAFSYDTGNHKIISELTSPESRYMASGASDRSVRVFQYPSDMSSPWTPEVVAEFSPHNGAIISVDWNPKYKYSFQCYQYL
jgi:WD40 repeat protein